MEKVDKIKKLPEQRAQMMEETTKTWDEFKQKELNKKNTEWKQANTTRYGWRMERNVHPRWTKRWEGEEQGIRKHHGRKKLTADREMETWK